MAYKFYLYRAWVFNSGHYSLAAEVAQPFCKGLYNKIFSDFDSIKPIGDWVTLDEYSDSYGIHEGIKRYFCIDDSNERQMAIILRDYRDNDPDSRWYNFEYTIAGAHEQNASDRGDGWEIVPREIGAYWESSHDGNKWYETDYWQVVVFTDENDKVVGISAPEYCYNYGANIQSFDIILFDKKNEIIVPGCYIQQSKRTYPYSYYRGYWLADYKTPYDITGQIVPANNHRFTVTGRKAIKQQALFNDMFGNTYAFNNISDIEINTFINENWDDNCWNRTIIVDDQSYQNFGICMFIPVSEKNTVTVQVQNVPIY